MKKIDSILAAVRGEMRHVGIDPEACTALDAERVLDDLGRKGHQAGLWFWSATDKQVNRFRKEWGQWQKQQ